MRIRCTTLLVLGLVVLTTGLVSAQASAQSSAQASAQVSALQNTPQVRPQHLNMQFHRAKTAFDSGASLLEAKTRMDIVLAGLPQDIEALKLRAAILMALDRPESAFHDARVAASLDPTDGEAHLLVCESGVAVKMEADALRSLEAATDLILDDVALYVRLSACAQQLNQIPPAEALARVAMASGDRDGRGHLQLARVFIQTDRPENAVTVLLQGLQERAVRAWDIRRDPLLAPLMDWEDLAAWRRR